MDTAITKQGLWWLSGGGEAAALARTTYWGATPLGPTASWPQSLRTIARICLDTIFPMAVLWGPEFVMLYNDGYRPILGDLKHPRGMGQRARECWPEIWPDVGPLLQGVLASGEPVWREDHRLLMMRNGYLEECYFTFSYSPIRDDAGGVGGVLATVNETTERVLGERRLRMLHQMAASVAGVTGVEEAATWFASALAMNPADLPFALLYDVTDGEARLVARAGVAGDSPLAAPRLAIGPDTPGWPVAGVVASGEPFEVREVATLLGLRAAIGDGMGETSALVLPIAVRDEGTAGTVLVAGVNPRRRLDAEYERFLHLVGHQVGAALASARARTEERERAALAASEARFRSFTASTPALIRTSGADGRCDFVNAAWLAFTGRTLEQELGEGWVAGVHPDDREACLRDFGAAVVERAPFRLEYRLRHASGAYRWIVDAGAPRIDADGTYLGHIGTSLDITEQRAAEIALRAEEEWLRALSECSPVGIFTYDDAGQVTYLNPTLQAIVGATAREPLGDGWMQFVHPADRERVRAAWRRTFARREGARVVMRILHPRDGVRWVHVRTAPLRLNGSIGAGYVGTVEDITEQREMEEALQRAELQYRELVEMAQAVVWRGVGELPRLTYVNGRAAELSGIPVERWIAEPALWLERTLPEDRAGVLRALQRSREGPQELTMRMRDVHERVLSLRAFVRYVGESTAGPEFIGMLFDETVLRQAREEAEASAERLQVAREQEQARIAREIHDELGQLLTGLKLQLAWHADRLPDDAAELVVSAGDMLALVDETIATVRRIALRLRPGVLDDLGLLAALEWLAHDFERRTGVCCRLVLPEALCAGAEAHATPLFRIAQEALTNVARHAAARSVELALRCEAGQCVLTVADDGCGMPAEPPRDGRSLGLLGMRERAIATGGDLTIDSRPREGTTITARVGRHRPAPVGAAP